MRYYCLIAFNIASRRQLPISICSTYRGYRYNSPSIIAPPSIAATIAIIAAAPVASNSLPLLTPQQFALLYITYYCYYCHWRFAQSGVAFAAALPAFITAPSAFCDPLLRFYPAVPLFINLLLICLI